MKIEIGSFSSHSTSKDYLTWVKLTRLWNGGNNLLELGILVLNFEHYCTTFLFNLGLELLNPILQRKILFCLQLFQLCIMPVHLVRRINWMWNFSSDIIFTQTVWIEIYRNTTKYTALKETFSLGVLVWITKDQDNRNFKLKKCLFANFEIAFIFFTCLRLRRWSWRKCMLLIVRLARIGMWSNIWCNNDNKSRVTLFR